MRKSCRALISPLRAPGFPRELQAVINKQFLFHVTLTKDSYRSEDLRKYLINSVSTPPQQAAGADPAVIEIDQQIMPPPVPLLTAGHTPPSPSQNRPCATPTNTVSLTISTSLTFLAIHGSAIPSSILYH